MKYRLSKFLSTPALGAALLLSHNYVLAQSAVDITTLGIGPVYELRCENQTNPQIGAAVSTAPNAWSCDSSGIVFNPGEAVVISITGDAMDPLFIGGRVNGLEPSVIINCHNQTSSQAAELVAPLYDWNCFDSGFVALPGETVVQTISGVVAGAGNDGVVVPPLFDHSSIVNETCSSCHTKPPIHISSGLECEACHNTNSWILATSPTDPQIPPDLPCVGLAVIGGPPCIPVDPCSVVIDPNLPVEPCVPVEPEPFPPIPPCDGIFPVAPDGSPCDPIGTPPPVDPCGGIVDPNLPGEPCLPVEPEPFPPTLPCDGVLPVAPDGTPCGPIPTPPPIDPGCVQIPVAGQPPCDIPPVPPIHPCDVNTIKPDGTPCDPVGSTPPEDPCGYILDPNLPNIPCIPVEPEPLPPVDPCSIIDPLPGEPCMPVDPVLPIGMPVNGIL